MIKLFEAVVYGLAGFVLYRMLRAWSTTYRRLSPSWRWQRPRCWYGRRSARHGGRSHERSSPHPATWFPDALAEI